MSCGYCYECQVCITCEKFGPRQQIPKPPRMPVQSCVPIQRQMPLTEEKVREIVMEILIAHGLIQPKQEHKSIEFTK